MSEPTLTVWYKQNGSEIKLNSEKATVEKAVSLGWKTEAMVAQEEKERKEELEKYAKEKFGVDLDKRSSVEKMEAKIAELEEAAEE